MAGSPARFQPEDDRWAIGMKLKLLSVFDETIVGTVFSFDSSNQAVVLEEDTADGKKTIRVLKAAFIKTVEALSKPELQAKLEHLPPVSLDKIAARERRSLQELQAKIDRIGVGVSEEAQAIFDALCFKGYPCYWNKTTIIVMGNIRIEEPYTPEFCTGGHKTSEVERLRKVLDGIMSQLNAAKK